jgi:ribose 1,5-bisphosphokinase
MIGRLVYIIGPSGAGKDSVLDALRGRWQAPPAAHWARRTITRPTSPHGEQHEAVDAPVFNDLLRACALGMHWSANGLRYGVRLEELRPLQDGHWVFVNGSRGYLPELLQAWPQATIVHIGASIPVLHARLVARGRESAQAISERLAREIEIELPADSISIQNDGALNEAVTALMNRLLQMTKRQ